MVMMKMQPYRQYRRNPAIWVFVAIIIGIVSLAIISAVFGRFSPPFYPPFFFFGWWFLIPLFFFGFFFFFRGWGCWSGGRWYDYDPALETLRERFARGEITREQYEETRKNLEQQ
jgi:uncharacterized membrane protein